MKISSILSFTLLIFTMAIAPNSFAAKSCKKGKPCGNACISKEDVCHKTEGSAQSAPIQSSNAPVTRETAPVVTETAPTTPASTDTKKARNCKKGKACGNSCIPEKAVCHAQ